MSAPEVVTRAVLVERYVTRQEATVEALSAKLDEIEKARAVTGWALLECHMLGSRLLGEYTLLPYGPGCTFKEPPTHPVSPRGLASDMAVVVAISIEVIR